MRAWILVLVLVGCTDSNGHTCFEPLDEGDYCPPEHTTPVGTKHRLVHFTATPTGYAALVSVSSPDRSVTEVVELDESGAARSIHELPSVESWDELRAFAADGEGGALVLVNEELRWLRDGAWVATEPLPAAGPSEAWHYIPAMGLFEDGYLVAVPGQRELRRYDRAGTRLDTIALPTALQPTLAIDPLAPGTAAISWLAADRMTTVVNRFDGAPPVDIAIRATDHTYHTQVAIRDGAIAMVFGGSSLVILTASNSLRTIALDLAVCEGLAGTETGYLVLCRESSEEVLLVLDPDGQRVRTEVTPAGWDHSMIASRPGSAMTAFSTDGGDVVAVPVTGEAAGTPQLVLDGDRTYVADQGCSATSSAPPLLPALALLGVCLARRRRRTALLAG